MAIPSRPRPSTLQEWLRYIEAQHPKSIAMGLERVREVAKRLQLTLDFPVIVVAGTNGKGSVCAMLGRIYSDAGYRVGVYTSPHLMHYNERICVNQQPISDAALCQAFEAVEVARGSVQLTYFEIGTLAAVWHFIRTGLDVAVLEVGMGGRLDAVNVFDATCAVVTCVDLDHLEFLGDTREKVGYEKAGVYRHNRLAVCGDRSPPTRLVEHAQQIGADLRMIGQQFTLTQDNQSWLYREGDYRLTLPELALRGDFQRDNAACVVCVVHHLQSQLAVSDAQLYAALSTTTLLGRFYQLQRQPTIIVDVAHNPQAAISLAHNLSVQSHAGRTLAVFAMLVDKDIAGVVTALNLHIDAWFLANIHHIRGASADQLKQKIETINQETPVYLYNTVADALKAARNDALENDRIIIFGSFYTVAEAIEALKY